MANCKFRRMVQLVPIVFLMLSVSAYSQTVIKGKVISEKTNEPLAGTVVQVGNTSQAVLTDVDGLFQLTTKTEYPVTLQMRLLGYHQQTVDVYDSSPVIVSLIEDQFLLDEVVVTALGINRQRNSLTYATQSVSENELNRVPAVDLVRSLSGKVAGLQITSANTLGGTNNVILRGFKSLTQSNQALFVVDGIPVDNTNQSRNGLDVGTTIADINPEDVESINVLKGAAASALYGSRAVNGVIVITTKKGKSKGLNIVFNQGIKTGVVDNSTLPTYQTQYGQGRGSYGYSATYPDQSGWFYYQPTFNSNGQPVNIVITNQDLAWGPAYNPSIPVYNWDAFVSGNPNYGKATPWTAASNNAASNYFDTPLASSTSLFLSGANDKSTYKIGYTYNYDGGIVPNSNIKKHVFNFGWSHDLFKQLTVGTSFNYSNTSTLNRSTYDYRAANSNIRDLRQWLPSNVDWKALRNDYDRGLNASWNIVAGNYQNATGEVIKAAYHNNPYWNDYENYNNDSRDRYFGNVYATYRIIDGLQTTARLARDQYKQFFENRVAVGSYQTSSYGRTDVEFSETNFDFLVNYDHSLTDKLGLKALLGASVRRTNNRSISIVTSGGLLVPGLYAISNSVATPAAPLEYDGTKQVNSAYAGVTLNYNDLFVVDATGRRDQSSALPEANNDYFYPAVSGSFIFSSLLKDVSWLNISKIRINYAEVGSDAPVYSLRNTYVAGTAFNGQNIYSTPQTNNNPDLKPERSKSYEIGLDVALFENRVNLDVTYYSSRLNDQITPITPSTATGYSNFYVNGGTIENKGVEVALNVAAVRTKDFDYRIGVNWSKNNNKVVSLYEGQLSYTIAGYHNSVQLVAEVGQPYGILRGTDYEYVNGQPLMDDNGYYVKSSNRNSDLGKVSPDWIGSITNSFRYKDFSLSFLIDASHGGNIYSLDMDNASRAGILPATAGNNDLGNPLRNPLSEGGGIILPGVKKDGTPNDIRIDVSNAQTLGGKLPFGSTNALAARSYIYDASYVKLREVALAYSLPNKIFAGSFIKGLTLAVSGRNLWIIHKNLPYADPEQGAPSTTLTNTDPLIYNANASIGYQNAVFPSVREVAFNVKLNF